MSSDKEQRLSTQKIVQGEFQRGQSASQTASNLAAAREAAAQSGSKPQSSNSEAKK